MGFKWDFKWGYLSVDFERGFLHGDFKRLLNRDFKWGFCLRSPYGGFEWGV